MKLNEAAILSTNWQKTQEQIYAMIEVSSDSSPQLSCTQHLMSLGLLLLQLQGESVIICRTLFTLQAS